ncbi:MAG: DUF542 domain-containing protein [Anaerolineae bacterium]|nr:MAG: DUF542 domain-containing protein [Anaerolineae bacterium]
MDRVPNLNPEQSVGAWVTADYRLAALFERHGIDFCCGGDKPLTTACAEHGVSPGPCWTRFAR